MTMTKWQIYATERRHVQWRYEKEKNKNDIKKLNFIYSHPKFQCCNISLTWHTQLWKWWPTEHSICLILCRSQWLKPIKTKEAFAKTILNPIAGWPVVPSSLRWMSVFRIIETSWNLMEILVIWWLATMQKPINMACFAAKIQIS